MSNEKYTIISDDESKSIKITEADQEAAFKRAKQLAREHRPIGFNVFYQNRHLGYFYSRELWEDIMRRMTEHEKEKREGFLPLPRKT